MVPAHNMITNGHRSKNNQKKELALASSFFDASCSYLHNVSAVNGYEE